MPNKAKLLFDECVGVPIVDQLAGVIGIGDDIIVEHAVRKGFGGMNDEDWIPLIANEGWGIITADSGKQAKRGKGKNCRLFARNGA